MQTVDLPHTGTAAAWRDAARAALVAGVPPHELLWTCGGGARDLFAGSRIFVENSHPAPRVPKAFVGLAETVAWHSDPERFARLYALLWRLRDAPRLLADRGDPDVDRLETMAKAVRRDMHKIKAFVRFREIGDPDAARRRFAAWFEPTHYTLEPTSSFFARRFADMDWSIVTPDLAAHFENGELRFAPGQPKPPLPDDATEALWTTYFRNIFNPARLKVHAMQAQMPKKYWKNMPETAAIPELIASAQTRAEAMRDAAPTLPPVRARKIQERRPMPDDPPPDATTLPGLAAAMQGCTRCPLYRNATQAVPGEGPPDAPLMVVGEQPGDQEDLAGRPFVGPAGQLFDRIAKDAGLDRRQAYVTNAVKHFKFQPRGKRRLHQRPVSDEIDHCKWWLEAERRLLQPKLILAMGATAAEAVTGSGESIMKRRGSLEATPDGTPVLLTLHPSYLLRVPDPAAKRAATDAFRADLARAAEILRAA